MYTIYHVPGIKVGCTSRSPEVRVREQGFIYYEILEKVETLALASQRERYWQEELNYKVDRSTYINSLANQVVATKAAQTKEIKEKRKATMQISEVFKDSIKNNARLLQRKEVIDKRKESYKNSKARKEVYDRKKIPVLQFNKAGDFIKEWTSGTEASKALGLYYTTVGACCRGYIKSAGGFIWKYKNN